MEGGRWRHDSQQSTHTRVGSQIMLERLDKCDGGKKKEKAKCREEKEGEWC